MKVAIVYTHSLNTLELVYLLNLCGTVHNFKRDQREDTHTHSPLPFTLYSHTHISPPSHPHTQELYESELQRSEQLNRRLQRAKEEAAESKTRLRCTHCQSCVVGWACITGA